MLQDVAIRRKRIVIEVVRKPKKVENKHEIKAKKLLNFLKTLKKNKKMTCSICLEHVKHGKICHTPCGHSFHYNCFDQVVTSFTGQWWYKCPNCRCDIFDCIMKLQKYKKQYESKCF